MESPNDDYTFKGSGLYGQEKRWGHERFVEYRQNYSHLHKMSDLYTLEELIFQEALQERLKKKLLKLTQPDNAEEGSNPVAGHYQKQLAENLDLQFKLKEKLGLFEDKKILDAFKDFQNLDEKFTEYRKQNPDLFATTCPQCAFTYYLKRRTVDYEPLSNVWFKDKVLFNQALFKAYKEQRPLTKKDLSDILGVSDFYVDWLEDKFLADTKNSEDDAGTSTNAEPQSPQE